MENAATMGTLLHEMGLVLQGLIDSDTANNLNVLFLILLRTFISIFLTAKNILLFL